MRTPYLRARTPAEVWQCLDGLNARTMVFDVEPLVAFWDTDQATLHDGVAAVLDSLTGSGPDAVVFATNSTRTPSTMSTADWAHITYLASAGKPVRIAAYRNLPHPGAVIGDQVATDGVLAWRLGYTFVHYVPHLPYIPIGPRLMRQIGRPIRPLLFQRP